MDNIISRADAKAQGLNHYFTGRPCKHGHLAKRYTRSADCIVCALSRATEFTKTNPEKRKQINAKYNSGPKKKQSTSTYLAKPSTKLKVRANHILRIYGLTVEQYELMYDQQGGVCKICREPEKNGRMLSVDHCHSSGKVRHLLCNRCNTMLGKVEERIDILNAMIDYLQDQYIHHHPGAGSHPIRLQSRSKYQHH